MNHINGTPWSSDHITKIKHMAEDLHMSARMIGDRFGTTRLAIIGVCARNKIKLGKNATTLKEIERIKKKTFKKENIIKERKKQFNESYYSKKYEGVKLINDMPSLGQCSFPIGDVGSCEFKFCFEKCSHTYCDKHIKVCYTKRERTGKQFDARILKCI